MSHLCPAWRCSWNVTDDGKLMCPGHWHMVPHPVQKAVYAAWANGEGRGMPALFAAQMAAIRAVNEKLQAAEQ